MICIWIYYLNYDIWSTGLYIYTCYQKSVLFISILPTQWSDLICILVWQSWRTCQQTRCPRSRGATGPFEVSQACSESITGSHLNFCLACSWLDLMSCKFRQWYPHKIKSDAVFWARRCSCKTSDHWLKYESETLNTFSLVSSQTAYILWWF